MNNCNLKYNIRLNIKTLKDILAYFDMSDKNTLIELVTYKKINKELDKYKEHIAYQEKDRIIFKNLKFEQLTYIMSKDPIFNIYFYKVGKKYDVKNLTHKLIHNENDASIHIRMDQIYEVCFNKDKFNEEKTKTYLKKYRKFINPEYIILFILLLIGIIINLIKK